MPAPPAGRSVCDLSASTNRVHGAKIRGARGVSQAPSELTRPITSFVLRERKA